MKTSASSTLRTPNASTLLSQLDQLDALATHATNKSRSTNKTRRTVHGRSNSAHMAGGSTTTTSQEDMDRIVQAVSNKLSMSTSMGSSNSESFGAVQRNRSEGSDPTSSQYATISRVVTVPTNPTKKLVPSTKVSSAPGLTPMFSNSSDDAELSPTKWYTRRRASLDSMEDSSSSVEDEQQGHIDGEFFDAGQSFHTSKEESDYESLPADPPRGGSNSCKLVPQRHFQRGDLDFESVWDEVGDPMEISGRKRVVARNGGIVGRGPSATAAVTQANKEEELESEDEEEEEEDYATSTEEEEEDYESDDAFSEEDNQSAISIPPPPPQRGMHKSRRESSSSLQQQDKEQNENGSDSAEDYSDDDDEGEDGYKPGGYHPVRIGEVYNQR